MTQAMRSLNSLVVPAFITVPKSEEEDAMKAWLLSRADLEDRSDGPRSVSLAFSPLQPIEVHEIVFLNTKICAMPLREVAAIWEWPLVSAQRDELLQPEDHPRC